MFATSNELVELYKAQLRLVESTANGAEWSIADLEAYDERAERIAVLQERLMASVAANPVALGMGAVPRLYTVN
jgi:hypothetical protein